MTGRSSSSSNGSKRASPCCSMNSRTAQWLAGLPPVPSRRALRSIVASAQAAASRASPSRHGVTPNAVANSPAAAISPSRCAALSIWPSAPAGISAATKSATIARTVSPSTRSADEPPHKFRPGRAIGGMRRILDCLRELPPRRRPARHCRTRQSPRLYRRECRASAPSARPEPGALYLRRAWLQSGFRPLKAPGRASFSARVKNRRARPAPCPCRCQPVNRRRRVARFDHAQFIEN